MRTHTQAFKEGIKDYGRQFNDSMQFKYGNSYIFVTQDEINRVNYSEDTTLCKSVMQKIEVDITKDVDITTYNTMQYGMSLANVPNDSINFRYFKVTKKEELKDTKSYRYTCYDNMIKTMVDYTTPLDNGTPITYPITIRDYLSAICNHLGISFGSSSVNFTNYDKQITSEHYLDSDGHSLGYTFRDVLDDIAECIGGFICIDNLGYLVIRYINQTIGKNLFDKNHSNIINGFFNGTPGSISSSNTARTLYIPCEHNTTYTISKIAGKRFRVATTTNEPIVGMNTNQATAKDTGTSITITTGNNDNYLLVYYYSSASGADTLPIETIINSIQIELGNEATTYEPYGDTINEDYLSDKNINIKDKISYNVVVLSRANDSDNIYYPSTLPENPKEFKISDNPILEQTNREDYIQGIYNNINGLEFHLNDIKSTGILYYEIGDKYNIKIGNTFYPCLMLSDNIIRTTGLKETIITNEPKQSVTPYKYASSTDKLDIQSKNAYIIADKANGTASMIVQGIGDNGVVTGASVIASINGDTSQASIDADKIDINANDVLNILSGNQINLTTKNITIASDNFSVDANGNLTCSNATINDGIIDLKDTGAYGIPVVQISRENNENNVWSSLGSYGLQINETYNSGNDRNRAMYESNNLFVRHEDYATGINTDTNIGDQGISVSYEDTNNSNNYRNAFMSYNELRLSHYENGTRIDDFNIDQNGNAIIGGSVVVGGIRTKNIFNKNQAYVGAWGPTTTDILSTGVRVNVDTGANRMVYYKLPDIVLGKTITLSTIMTPNKTNNGMARLYYGTSSSPASTNIGDLNSSGSITRTIASSYPSGTDGVYLLLYGNKNGTGYSGSAYVDFTNLQIEINDNATTYSSYQNLDGESFEKISISTNVGTLSTNSSYKSRHSLNINLKISGVSISANMGVTIATLPSNCSPTSESSLMAVTNNYVPLVCWLRNNGTIAIATGTAISNVEVRIVGSVYLD